MIRIWPIEPVGVAPPSAEAIVKPTIPTSSVRRWPKTSASLLGKRGAQAPAVAPARTLATLRGLRR
jgi:hypothetical protein